MTGVHVAGIGLACALGEDLPAALAALRRGGVRPTSVAVAEGCSWPVYRLAPSPGSWLERARRTVRSVVAQSGALAARSGPLFVASSSLDIGHEEQEGVFPGDVHAFADAVSGWIDWQGPVFTVSTACTSAVNAVLDASALIRSGAAERALVLGVELPNRFTLAGFGAMQLLAPESAQPFGAARNGLVLGEAVAALRLSSRPARWRIRGGANVVHGHNPAGTEASAVIAMCHEALCRSELSPQDIDLIKPQAAGSPINDAIEAAALREVFARLPPLVSLKAGIGHTLGAAGAAEMILLAGCIETGTWPTIDYPLDPALRLRLNTGAPARLRHILLNTVGFGGGHTALVLEDRGA